MHDLSTLTREQILSGFTPPPGPEASEEETHRYWNDYYEKRRSFWQNRDRYPLGDLEQYLGKTLVWSPDGMNLLGVGPDPFTVQQHIEALGVDPLLLVLQSIPDNLDEVSA
jgi:hypothetical protein